ncbi:UDP-glycosyltransferase UGT5-like [Zerene cesonia]|uniref:UDP-glycosyltransferase UGT5-like n=1 Tax=Zerene cesonia TaxID=33412 RepID=UPI0018E4F27E|nr:UDP-glycosyltransferase UGT5-like [Zerene cesonia]
MMCINSYKILIIFPLPAKSHSILGDGIVNALAKAGHEITYLTSIPHGQRPSNVREIDLSMDIKPAPDSVGDIKHYFSKDKNSKNVSTFINSLYDLYGQVVKNKGVQKLIDDPSEQFDVIIIEWFLFNFIAGFSAIFKSPYIWVSTTDPGYEVLQLVGGSINPAYAPDSSSFNVPPFNFYQRCEELLYFLGVLYREHFIFNPSQYKEYEKLFVPAIKKRGHAVPSLDEVVYNASLILSNSHASMGKAISLPQNFIPIGGYHISQDLKPLPENLQKILDNAKNGVIYFSLGSNLKSKHLPREIKEALLKIFGGLKYTVLWKFEEELPGTPSNVHIVKWAPQQSILAHRNCVLFITHGGQLSTTEAVYFGKPIIAIPVFADQFINAERAVQKGFAKRVDLSYTMADDIKVAIGEILNDPKYTTKVKELSQIYKDRPVTPDKELVQWVEHVVKTRGAPHLRSPALDVPLYQKLYLDLLALAVTVLISIVVALRKLLTCLRGGYRQPGNVIKQKRQ